MVYDHMVKVNGQYYQTGEDVPEIKNMAGEEISSAEPQEKEPDMPFEPQTYTKTQINRMNVDELRRMAANTGVEGADKMTGTELKEYLISLFGL